MRPHSLLTRYAVGLTSAYVLTVAEVTAMIVSLVGHQVVTVANIVAAVVVVLIGTATVAVGSVVVIAPSQRWLASDGHPTPAQAHASAKTMFHQSAITFTPWALSVAVLVPLNLHSGTGVVIVITSAMLFGAIATACTGFMFTMRTLRPVLARIPEDVSRPAAPGVRARLIIMWIVCTALPGTAIASLLIMRSKGWIFDDSTPIELALLVLSLVAVVLGLRAMILVSMSISDPVGQVVDAMAEVERGNIDRTIDVYEWSEIGKLQSGFNRMVVGLQERDRLRDLFGRHVGEEVARRAVDVTESLSGDERDVAVLFVDLVGSTQLAVKNEPHEVADVLNDFFRIVVAAVDEHHGLINKFQGDAALAVFGAPLRIDDPASVAMSTARALATELRSLPVDYGIGVSAGPVFAGNIGAENRYEYTVVGDAVNEAARLADCAKEFDCRALCSGAVFDRAGAAERERWSAHGETTLRGRSDATDIYTPTVHEDDARVSSPSDRPETSA